MAQGDICPSTSARRAPACWTDGREPGPGLHGRRSTADYFDRLVVRTADSLACCWRGVVACYSELRGVPYEPHGSTMYGSEPGRIVLCCPHAPVAMELGSMSQVDYEVAGREAHRYAFGNEFLRVELYDGYFSIAWSTMLPIADVVVRVGPLLQSIAGNAVVFDARTRAHERIGAEGAVDRLLMDEGNLSFARVELPGITLVWEQSGLQDRDRQDEPGELALLAAVFDEEALVRIIHATATGHVARDARQLIGGLAYVADHVGRGHLASAGLDSGT